ncbi:MAG TPA: FAD-dependent oxidoreductase [Burkholderiaceae bacterium]
MNVSFWEQDAMLDADFIVIGGGIIGLQTALELRQREPRASIVVLERGLLPSGASSRNAGFACFGSLTEILADIEELGQVAAIALVERRWRGLNRLRARMDDAALGFECFGGSELLLEKHLPALEQLDSLNAILHDLFGQNIFALDTEGLQRSKFGPLVKAMVFNPLEAQIHSGRAMRSLAKLAAQQGIEIHTGAEVAGLEDTGAQVQVTTGGERPLTFRAARVALCTSGVTAKLLPECGIVPGRGQVVVTTPISGLPWRGTFHMDEGFYYFRNVGDRVLLGGGRNLDFDTEQTSDMALSGKIQSALEALLHETILPGQTFEIEHRWAGIMGFTEQGMPQVRMASERVAIGFGCNGMGVALSADIAAETAKLLSEQ